jgi:tetratricopeptide (TPR) repeat protein
MSMTSKRNCVTAKHRQTSLVLIVLLFTWIPPGSSSGQQTAGDFIKRGSEKIVKYDWDGAIADFTNAIELDPKSAEAYDDRGKARVGDWDGAIADFTKAIELNPENPDAYMNRGQAKEAKGDQAGADADFAQAEKLKTQIPAQPTK